MEQRLARVEELRMTAPSLAEAGDEALVAAARQGNREAYGVLYMRYARVVHGILLSKVPASDADDLVHDIFLRALPHLGELRDATHFGAWLAAITRNHANDYCRRSRSATEFREADFDADAIASPSNTDDEAAARAILDAVRSLPEAYRETLIMRLVEGLTGPEIASRTGLSHGSVRVNLHRGMRQLRERLSYIRQERK
jgi:RNA polymerase sigma-70 factor (ECF subfamily)